MTSPATVRWRYTFCDLRTRTRLAELPLLGADLAEAIGAPASGSGTVPLSSAEVRRKDPWSATVPRRTICFAQRVLSLGGREVAAPVVWAGIVWKRDRSGLGLKLSMATPESYWSMRLAAQDRVFVNADDALIQRTIFVDAEAVPNGSLGLAVGSATVGTTSDRTVLASDLDTVLEVAQSVAGSGQVLEWRVRPGWDPVGRRFTLALDQARHLGSPGAAGQLHWVSAGAGRPGNEVLGYDLVEDGAGVPNAVVGIGGEEGTPLRSVATAALLGVDEMALGYPLLEVPLGSSTTGVTTQAALDKHTSAELAALQAGEVQVTSMTVAGDRGPELSSWGLGDSVTLTARDPLHREPRDYVGRVLARRILPVEAGRAETVTMTLGVV